MDVQRLISRAVDCFSNRAFDDAAALLRQALDREPDNPHALNNLGQIQFLKRELAAAASCFERVLARDPAFVPSAYGLAKVHLAQGAYDHALRALQAIQPCVDDTDRAEFYQLLGLVFVGKRDWEVAVNYLRKFAAERPDDPDPLLALHATYLSMDDAPAAMRALEAAAVARPQADPYWIQLLKEAREQDGGERLQSVVNHMLSLRGDSLALLNFAAAACLETGGYAYAARCARAAQDRHPRYPKDQFQALARAAALL